MNEKDVQKYLAAFADGELDVQDNLRVLEHIRMNPQATRRVMHQQQLRRAVERSLNEQAPALPDEMRAKLEAMARQTPEAAVPAAASHAQSIDEAEAPRGVLARIGRWAPAAIAAMLLIGAGLFYMQAHNAIQNPVGPPDGQTPIQTVSQMLSPQVQAALTSKHLRCRSEVNRLHNAARFPQDANAVAPVVDSFLEGEGHTYAALDLEAVGYDYVGAGECRSPGARAVHLIYKPADAALEEGKGLSLWVCADTGQLNHLAKDWLYKVEVDQTGQPIVVWRHEGMVYYLTGGSAAAVERAARALVTRS